MDRQAPEVSPTTMINTSTGWQMAGLLAGRMPILDTSFGMKRAAHLEKPFLRAREQAAGGPDNPPGAAIHAG
jgi:hypothetical protein